MTKTIAKNSCESGVVCARRTSAARRVFTSNQRPTTSNRAPAFTLIEVMISVAISLALMVGVSYIFKWVGQAAGAGQALSDGNRNNRAAAAEMNRDFGNMVTADAPFITISSSLRPAFRSKVDEDGDPDGNPLTADIFGGGPDSASFSPADITYREHRLDSVGFLARDIFPRQTGGLIDPAKAPPVYADMSSGEAYVWYGHLWLPDNQGQFSANTLPGHGNRTSNPNNLYATQWVLGRRAVLVREADKRQSSGAPYMADRGGTDQQFYYQYPMPNAPAYYTSNVSDMLYPLTMGSPAWDNNSRHAVESSRYDLAQTSVNEFRTRLATYLDRIDADNKPNTDWWSNLFASDGARFQAKTFISKPTSAMSQTQVAQLVSDEMAYTAPVFLPNCTQFIVEYAGDFFSQNPVNGEITDAGCWSYRDTNTSTVVSQQRPLNTDGQIDYVLVTGPNGAISKQIRWYGMPRDTSGGNVAVLGGGSGLPDGSIQGYRPNSNSSSASYMPDVVPLRDVMHAFLLGKVSSDALGRKGREIVGIPAPVTDSDLDTCAAPFEKINYGNTPTLAPAAGLNTLTNAKPDYKIGMKLNETYTCAWSPRDVIKPSLIRITIVLDDPNGRIADGQTFEYVFKVQ